jgi:hypothetical protein
MVKSTIDDAPVPSAFGLRPVAEKTHDAATKMSRLELCTTTDGASPDQSPDIASARVLGLPTVYAAIIHDADGVRLLVVGASREAVTAGLARYVRRHAAERLWPHDRRRVERLLARGMLDAAVGEYFERVGARWDEECLYRGTTELVSEHLLRAAGTGDGV